MSLPPQQPPRLVVRVGVSGHRGGERLAESVRPRIHAQVSEILRRCRNAAHQLHTGPAAGTTAEPPDLVAISCLAAGADQILAQEALAQGWRLQVVLPFVRGEYAADFDEPAGLAEFDALLAAADDVVEIAIPRAARDASLAYEEAGLAMLDRSDFLVAIWDGGESGGRGGTREVIDEALRRAKPVLWVNTVAAEPAAQWDGAKAMPMRMEEILAKLLRPDTATPP